MLISEVLGIEIDDIVKESDEFALKSSLDAIILDIKEKLQHNKNMVLTLDSVIGMLNAKSEFLQIDPRDEDRRNFIIQAFEDHGMDIERGAGKIALQHMDAAKTDGEEVEKEQQTRKVEKGAMANIKKNNDSAGGSL